MEEINFFGEMARTNRVTRGDIIGNEEIQYLAVALAQCFSCANELISFCF